MMKGEKKLTGKELYEATEDFINSFCRGKEADEFIESMNTTHRTLQQSYTRFVMKWIKAQAESKYFDGRNEQSVMKCRQIMKVLDNDINLPLI